MNRLILTIISIFFLNNCSLNENSRIWKDKERKLENDKNIKKVFSNEKKITTELNKELELDLTKIKTNKRTLDNTNNYGSQDYECLTKKIGSY